MQQLSSYWIKSPSASDDPAGIHRWWLAEPQNVTLDQLMRGLAWMLRRGLIEERRTPDGRVRYRRKRDANLSELERLAKGTPASPQTRPGGG